MKICSMLAVAIGLAAMFTSALQAAPTQVQHAKDAYSHKCAHATKAAICAKATEKQSCCCAKQTDEKKAECCCAKQTGEKKAECRCASCTHAKGDYPVKPSVKKMQEMKQGRCEKR